MNTITSNTQAFFLAGLLLSGCAGMSVAERQAQAEWAQIREADSRKAREMEASQAKEKEKKEKDYQVARKHLEKEVNDGVTLPSVALAADFELQEEAFGPPNADQRQYNLYLITLYERKEAGELTWAQVNYLKAEKVNEINARIRQEQAAAQQEEYARQQELKAILLESQQRTEQRIDAEYARDSAALRNIIYNNAMQNMLPRRPVTCNTYFNTTTCY